MGNSAFPRALFPSDAQIKKWALAGNWGVFEHLRLRALEHFVQYPVHKDKELERFIKPSIDWETFSCVEDKPFFEDLGSGAWIADSESMPFRPAQLDQLIEQLFSQPSSIAHFVLATFSQVRVLYIPKNTVVPEPIFLRSVLLEPECSMQYLICIIEEQSSVTIIDTHDSQGVQARLLSGFVGDGAEVKIHFDYTYGPKAYGLSHEVWRVGKKASLKTLDGSTGGRQVWGKKEFMVGEAAHVESLSLAALKGHEETALVTSQVHQGPESTSSVMVKAVLLDSARSFYRGTIGIEEQAQKSQADQQQRALILGPTAQCCAIPSLEVATHDVQCGHGSAAGRFNDEHLIYLHSRGLAQEQAHDILIEGFFKDGFGGSPEMVHRLKERCRGSA